MNWQLVGKALAHGTKADWANEGSHWRANEEEFIVNSLAQSSDVIWAGFTRDQSGPQSAYMRVSLWLQSDGRVEKGCGDQTDTHTKGHRILII